MKSTPSIVYISCIFFAFITISTTSPPTPPVTNTFGSIVSSIPTTNDMYTTCFNTTLTRNFHDAGTVNVTVMMWEYQAYEGITPPYMFGEDNIMLSNTATVELCVDVNVSTIYKATLEVKGDSGFLAIDTIYLLVHSKGRAVLEWPWTFATRQNLDQPLQYGRFRIPCTQDIEINAKILGAGPWEGAQGTSISYGARDQNSEQQAAITYYMAFVERDANGAIDVATAYMNAFNWTTSYSTLLDDTRFYKVTGVSLNTPTLQVAFTFIAAYYATGVASMKDIISNKVLESTVQVNGWPYHSKHNRLAITIEAASFAVSNTTLAQEELVYFDLNNTAIVGGHPHSVHVASSSRKEGQLYNALEKICLNYVGDCALHVQQFNATFPAGAESILYYSTPQLATQPKVPKTDTDTDTDMGQGLKIAVVRLLVFVVVLTMFLVLRKK